MRQCVALLGYGEAHVLELFEHTMPTRLYWVIFPIMDLRQATDEKRLMPK